VKCVYNASILYNIFTISSLIISRLNLKDLWGSFLLLQCLTDVIWNLVQLIKSLICVLETQMTVHLVQLWVLKEDIHTFLCSVVIVKPQRSAILNTVVKRKVVSILEFVAQFKNNNTCLTIRCCVENLNSVSTTTCHLLKCLHLNRWWGRQ